MDRRAFLVGAGGAASALAGCVGPVTLGSPSVAERDLPERPAEPTPAAVAAYVAEYEEVRAHNDRAREGATEVTVEAVATFDHGSGGECVATAQHAGTAHYEDDGAKSVGELYGRPVPYLVAPDRTLRMPVTRRRVGGGASGRPSDETASPPLGVRLCNVTDEPREFAVTVVRRSAAGDADGSSDPDIGAGSDGPGDPVLSTTVALDPERAVELLEITDVRGGYRVTATMEDDGVTGQGRIEVGLPSADRGPNVDVVVDEGGVSAWHLPSFEEI
ncbi:hypothetical protein [Halorubrum sp. Boch-26]|uniref:hypothetical protein n=1 Tax=Halorubrum sp. Boch-26 TaxID=2994426 RepID=UPI002469159D|nr:hypothetical protein [Halorubrum sp. Boch-26]